MHSKSEMKRIAVMQGKDMGHYTDIQNTAEQVQEESPEQEGVIPHPLLEAILKAYCEAYDIKPDAVVANSDFEKFRDGFLTAHAQVHDLVIKNGNLTQSFLMMMKDLRTYTTWLIRSRIGNTPVNGNQYNQAKFMQETLDQIAQSKGWNIIDEEATKL